MLRGALPPHHLHQADAELSGIDLRELLDESTEVTKSRDAVNRMKEKVHEHSDKARAKKAKARSDLQSKRTATQTAEKNNFKESLYKESEMADDDGAEEMPDASAAREVKLSGDITNKSRYKAKDLSTWIKKHKTKKRFPTTIKKNRENFVDFILTHPDCPTDVKEKTTRDPDKYPKCSICKTAGCTAKECPMKPKPGARSIAMRLRSDSA